MLNTIKNIPPTYFFTGIIAITLIYFLLPQYKTITFPYNLFGILLLFIGVFVNVNAKRLMKKYNTSHRFEKSIYLVEEGIFKFSRNPMYLGLSLILMGFAFISKNIMTFISPVIFFFLMNRIFIPYEEKKMYLELGKEYLKYKEKVRRWI